MGSIQGLRSAAMAMRAKEDTNVQVSGHLGGVNKQLGGQINQMMDGLQAVITERTKAYNGLVSKLNQSINGKGGIGDSAVQWAFKAVKAIVSSIKSTIAAVSCTIAAAQAATEAGMSLASAIFNGIQSSAAAAITNAADAAQYTTAATQDGLTAAEKTAAAASAGLGAAKAIAQAVADLAELVSVVLGAQVIEANIRSALYDYHKMSSQLGFSEVDNPANYNNADPPYDGQGLEDTSAVRTLRTRDALMPRYKSTQFYSPRGPAGGNYSYVGTLRRV